VFTLTAAAQLCVLGVMWMLGALLFQDHGSPALLYLFTAFNSLQGALFFILHCLLSKQVWGVPVCVCVGVSVCVGGCVYV